jgi:hypothetical protein
LIKNYELKITPVENPQKPVDKLWISLGKNRVILWIKFSSTKDLWEKSRFFHRFSTGEDPLNCREGGRLGSFSTFSTAPTTTVLNLKKIEEV